MKRTLSILLVFVLLAGVAFTLTSCDAILLGTYENDVLNTTIEFKFNKFTMITEMPLVGDVVKTGTYKITGDDGDREITFTFEDGESETSSFSNGVIDGEKYVKIGGITFTEDD